MKLVFLLGSYYPNYSAVSKCINNITEELGEEYEIIIISDMDNQNYKNYEEVNKEKIYRIRTKRMNKRDNLDYKIKGSKNRLFKSIHLAHKFYLRTFDYLKILCSPVSVDKDLVNEYIKTLKSIENIYAVFPTCYPFESVIAAINYTESKNVKFFPILFDKFSDSPTLHKFKLNKRLKFQKHLKLEENMIEKAEIIYYTEAWIENMLKYSKKDPNPKLIQIGHPLIKKIKREKSESNEKNNFVYTGVLDKIVRSPEKALSFFEYAIEKNNNNILEIYSIGNCEEYIKKAAFNQKNNIFNRGYVDTQTSSDKQKKSDFLVSIGNSDISLIPSKIYEYISLGKPIIHFYKDSNDPVIKILEKYNNSFVINENEVINYKIPKLYSEFEYFIEKNKYKTVKYEEVEEKFKDCTPLFVSEIIKSKLTGDI